MIAKAVETTGWNQDLMSIRAGTGTTLALHPLGEAVVAVASRAARGMVDKVEAESAPQESWHGA